MKAVWMVAGMVSAGLLGLSALPEPAGAETKAETPAQREIRKCFRPGDIHSYDTDRSGFVTIETYRGDVYELKMQGACIGLDTAMKIGVRARGNSICSAFDGEIIYSDRGIGGRLEKCAIVGVTPLGHKDDLEAATQTERKDG